MFKQLTNFSYERNVKEAIGLYLAYLLLIVILAIVVGWLVRLTLGDYILGISLRGAGNIVAIISSLVIALLIVKKKKLFGNFINILLILLSGVLAILGGGLLGLIPVAYLSTRQVRADSQIDKDNLTATYKSTFPDTINQENKKRTTRIVWFTLIPVFFVIVVCIVIAGILGLNKASNNSNATATISPSLSSISNWISYAEPNGYFSVSLPSQPTSDIESKTISGVKVTTTLYTSQSSNSNEVYIAGYGTYNGYNPPDTEQTLTGMMNGSLNNVQSSSLVSSNFTTFNGNKAIEYEMKVVQNGETLYAKYLDFVKGGKSYFLGVTSTDSNNFPYYDYFINSFKTGSL
jgi:hypothetical protein